MNINPEWIFGFNKDIPCSIHDLSSEKRQAIFYISSQYGVIYDYNRRTQLLLEGHRNNISCCCVSLDKKWIVTADEGDDSIVLVWDALNGIPMKSIYAAHAIGVKSIDISGDSMYLSTIGAQNDIAIWAWTQQSNELIAIERLYNSSESFIRFHPCDNGIFVSWGSESLTFWRRDTSTLLGCTFPLSNIDSSGNVGSITSVSYTKRDHAIACTSEGYAILWSHSHLTKNGSMKPVKVVKLTEHGINVCNITGNYIVVGCRDGSVRFYDDSFRLDAWYEDLNAGAIISIAFCNSSGDMEMDTTKFHCSDFIVSTEYSFVIKLTSAMFNQVLVEDRRGILLLQGFAGRVNKLSCHSTRPLLAISCENGMVQLWNYELMLLLNVRDFSSAVKVFTEKFLSSLTYPSAISFPPTGNFLAVAFSNGLLKIINDETLEDISTFAPTSNAILGIEFSKDAKFMSCYDDNGYVMLFKRLENSYDYIGRVHSHCNALSGLSFGFQDKTELLLSIGSDGKCVEYDLSLSSLECGVLVNSNSKSSTLLDASVFPTALCWHPDVTNGLEDR
jgi:cilia- and flagella-associated protein 251